ncbi:MAG: hypothetical protein M1570_03425 [Chloroflexi bacterium]|nr:hypothetical protein [Chloroflexota bacterium]
MFIYNERGLDWIVAATQPKAFLTSLAAGRASARMSSNEEEARVSAIRRPIFDDPVDRNVESL